MVQGKKKKRVLVINQYYFPDKASTGQLLTELCEYLNDHFELTVLCGTPSYSISDAETSSIKSLNQVNGVRVIRAFNTKFGRKNILGRLTNYLTFMFFASIKAIFMKKHDVIIVMSDPPTVNFTGYLTKLFRGGKLIQICQDIYPEIAISLGQADSKFLLTPFKFINRISQNACSKLVAISDDMKERLNKKGLPLNKIEVIENWIDTDIVLPETKNNKFAGSHCLTDKFVVMHSGNIGLSQNLNLLIETAEILKDHTDIIFVLIGDGAKKQELIALADSKSLNNILFLPYQKKEDIRYSLSSADIHFLSLKKGLTGLIVPSKIYGIMAAGRSFVACLEENSHFRNLIKKEHLGQIVPKEDPKLIAKEILYFYNRRELCSEYGIRAREFIVKTNSKKVILPRYLDLIENI